MRRRVSIAHLEADRLMEVADLDGDGALDLEELRAAMRPTRVG